MKRILNSADIAKEAEPAIEKAPVKSHSKLLLDLLVEKGLISQTEADSIEK